MSFRVVADSSCEIPEEWREDPRIVSIPLTILIGDDIFVDDAKLDQKLLLEKIAAYPGCPKSACPSPEAYMESYHCDADRVYVITLTSRLSGSYNAAELGRRLYEETYGEKDIYVLDSRTGTAGETAMLMEIMRLETSEALSFRETVAAWEHFRDEHLTYFVIDNLETLRKNGRLSGLKAALATTMKIKPILKAADGVIEQHSQAIGSRKALSKMVDALLEEARAKGWKTENKSLAISYCNCPEKVSLVKSMLEAKAAFKHISVNSATGLSTLYMNDGGIVLAM